MSPTSELTLSQFVLNAAVKPFRRLSSQEERVADLVARGLSYKRIGDRLKLSPRTVQAHVNMIAGLLPDDGLPARERVQVWALCAAIKKECQRGVA